MLSDLQDQPVAKTDTATLFVERLPDKDAQLAAYKIAFRDLGLRSKLKFRLFRRYEIEGINQSEALFVNYKVFSELGLDRVADPTELFEQEFILAVSQSRWQQDIETISGLELLQLNFPFRRVSLRRTEIFLFEDKLSKPEQELLTNFFTYERGYVQVSLKSHSAKSRPVDPLRQNKANSLDDILNIQAADLEDVLENLGARYRKQDVSADDLLVLVGNNFNFYYFNDKMQAYLDRILMQNLSLKKLQTIYKQAYNLNDIPLLASLYGLAYGSVINLDIISQVRAGFDPRELLTNKLSACFLLIIRQADRDRFFKAMQEVDLQATVIGQMQDTGQIKVLYQGQEIVEVDQEANTKQKKSMPVKRSLVGVSKARLTEAAKNLYRPGVKEITGQSQETRVNSSGKAQNLLLLNYPGAKALDDLIMQLDLTSRKFTIHNLTILSYDKFVHSLEKLAGKIEQCDILIIPDGYNLASNFIATDKLLCHCLEWGPVKQAINDLLARQGKIYGLGNGFKSLLACGLLPYGRFREWGDQQAFFYYRLFAASSASQDKLVDEFQVEQGDKRIQLACLEMPFQLWQFCLEKRLILQTSDHVNLETIEALTSPNHQCLGSLSLKESVDLSKDYLK